MENTREVHEGMKAEIQQLKEQMSHMLEALKALKSNGETSVLPQQQGAQIIQPLFGQPLKYTPHIEDDSKQTYTQKAGNSIDTEANELGAFIFTSNQGIVESNVVREEPTKQPEVNYLPHDTMLVDVENTRGKLEMLEERLRVIEGRGSFEFGDAVGLCLIADVVIPPKFKVPEFEKYKGPKETYNHVLQKNGSLCT